MNFEERQELYGKLNNIAYYLIICVVSILATLFIPALGTSIGLAWNIPTTTAGWVVFIVSKLIVGVINVLIFYCFMEQAKVNVKDNEKYKAANELYSRIIKEKKLKARSPARWNSTQYWTKGLTIFVTSILSAVGLTNAILTFDIISFFTYLFTIIMGMIFGFLQMRKAEAYWISEYPEYVDMVIKEQEKEKELPITNEEEGGKRKCSKSKKKSTEISKNKSSTTQTK